MFLRRAFRVFAGIVICLAGIVVLSMAALGMISDPRAAIAPVPSTMPSNSESARLPSQEVLHGIPEWIQIDPGVLSRVAMYPGALDIVGGILDPVDDRPVLINDTNQPGTDSPGTTGIVGHNYAKDGEDPPFAALENVRLGDTVLLGMPTGILRYTVDEARRIPKADLANPVAALADLRQPVKGRLVLLTCYTDNEKATYDNFVVVAHLSDATS